MKIRLSSQSIRFRLNPEDLTQLANRQNIIETISVTDGLKWQFELQVVAGLESGKAEFAGTRLILELPETEILSWLESKSLNWEYKQTHPNLEFSVEKDVKPDRDEKMKSRRS